MPFDLHALLQAPEPDAEFWAGAISRAVSSTPAEAQSELVFGLVGDSYVAGSDHLDDAGDDQDQPDRSDDETDGGFTDRASADDPSDRADDWLSAPSHPIDPDQLTHPDFPPISDVPTNSDLPTNSDDHDPWT